MPCRDGRTDDYELNLASHAATSISDIITFHLGLYVPTYIDLAFQHALPDGDRPYKPMKTPRVVDFSKLLSTLAKPKGKGKKATKADEDGTAVYLEEKEFLIEMLCKYLVRHCSRRGNIANVAPS
jgi:hypothetical protein